MMLLLGELIMLDIEESWKYHVSTKENLLDFENWFETCSSLDECVSNGIMDFSHRIFTPDFYQYIGNPKLCTSLEIGFGGGRLINCASKYFKHCYGIDIIDYKDIAMSEKFLKTYKCEENYTLYNYSHKELLRDKTIDFVYSFVVFQHFKDFTVIEDYIKLIKRVMKPNACGILYFGNNVYTNDNIYLDHENFTNKECTLFVKPDFMKQYMKQNFEVLKVIIPPKKLYNQERSGQFYIKFRNNEN